MPGQGYKVFLNSAGTLTYPINRDYVVGSILTKRQFAENGSVPNEPVHYNSYASRTGTNATLLVMSKDLQNGDEIAVKTETGLLVGSGVVTENKAVVTIWEDDIQTENVIEGAKEGEALVLMCWSTSKHQEGTLTFSLITDALTGLKLEPILQYKRDGAWIIKETQVVSVENVPSIPKSYSLEQNYPNPFNPSTTIKYALPQSGKVTLEIFNVLGEKVLTLLDAEQGAGYHQVIFKSSGLSSGVYIYRLSACTYTASKKMIILQ
jgi:hypothetical protein